jgi:hypothetical protein
MLKEARTQLPGLLDSLRTLPQLAQQAIQRAADGRLSVPVVTRDLEILRQEIREDARRRDITLICAVVLLGGLFWLAVDRDPLWPGFALVAGSLLSLWYARR